MRIEQLPIQEQEIIYNELMQWLEETHVQEISEEEIIKMAKECQPQELNIQ